MKNTTEYPIVSGKANMFLGSSFTGNTQFRDVPVGETFHVSFGADDAIKITREELKMQKEAGIFGKNKLTYRYRIHLQNLKTESQVVNVLDQLPVSQAESVKVKLAESIPEPNEKKEDGSLKWSIALQPGEKKDITFQFEIEYPKDGDLQGL